MDSELLEYPEGLRADRVLGGPQLSCDLLFVVSLGNPIKDHDLMIGQYTIARHVVPVLHGQRIEIDNPTTYSRRYSTDQIRRTELRFNAFNFRQDPERGNSDTLSDLKSAQPLRRKRQNRNLAFGNLLAVRRRPENRRRKITEVENSVTQCHDHRLHRTGSAETPVNYRSV